MTANHAHNPLQVQKNKDKNKRKKKVNLKHRWSLGPQWSDKMIHPWFAPSPFSTRCQWARWLAAWLWAVEDQLCSNWSMKSSSPGFYQPLPNANVCFGTSWQCCMAGPAPCVFPPCVLPAEGAGAWNHVCPVFGEWKGTGEGKTKVWVGKRSSFVSTGRNLMAWQGNRKTGKQAEKIKQCGGPHAD